MRTLGSVAVDGHRLEAQTPGLGIGLDNVVEGRVVGQVDGFRDGSGEERLGRSHHLDMAGGVDGARPFAGLEAAIKHGEMLRLDAGRAFNGAGRIDVADDRIHLGIGVAELEQGDGHGVVDDFDHSPAHQLLVLDQGKIGLDAGGVAVHHEADGAGGGKHGDLRIAVAMLLAVGQGLVPAILAGLDERSQLRRGEGLGGVGMADLVHFGAVHADDVEERLAVDIEAGASAAPLGQAAVGILRLLAKRGGGDQGGAFSARTEDCR